MTKEFIFKGRPDGIGNRIEELIYIQEYCLENNLSCIYFWNNIKIRNYQPLITFDNIKITDKIDCILENKLEIKNNKIFKRTKGNIIKYNFNFNINNIQEYDTIIHIRATDRLLPQGTGDFSSHKQLKIFIEKTIEYINNNSNIQTCAIVSDDNLYKNYMKNKIKKTYIDLSYNYNIPIDWLDYYYLTRATKNIIMCCKFSSYSITASILSNKKLLIFRESLNSNLPRYKADIEIIN